MAKDINVAEEAALMAVTAVQKNRDSLQKLIDAWNSKNAQTGRRIGSFGFMAAALAACGGGGSGGGGNSGGGNGGCAAQRDNL